MPFSLRRLVRNALPAMDRRRSTASAAPLETRDELSTRYMRELSDLVHGGEIGAAAARQIVLDLFDPAEHGHPPRLRLAVWQDYVRDRGGSLGPYLVARQAAGRFEEQ